MFDMRYHIASLGAVFLALTVGLLLGSLLTDSGTATRRQAKLMESINSDVNNIQQQNQLLEKEISDLKTFQSQVWRAAVKGRLTDQKIAVISLSAHQDELYDSLSKALVQAGAKSDHLKLDVAAVNFGDAVLVGKLAASISSTETTTTFEAIFWPRLAQEISGREPLLLTGALINLGLLSVDDQSGLPADGVVLLASKKGTVDDRDTKLLSAFRQVPGLPLIGAETDTFKPSRISAYQLTGASTIDNINTIPGWISMTYLLQQNSVKASFGVKSTADRLLPQ